ncbi:MAG: SDR family NAD(P)-dependent oxidoreductase [Pseudomonadota bacterium]
MKPALVDQVVWITGASSGIGEQLARALTASRLILTARRVDRLEKLRDELGADRVALCAGDVTENLDAVLAPGLERFGRLDAAIANAGFGVAADTAELAVADLQRQLDVNVFGVLRTVQAALPALRASRGRMGIVGSVAGYVTPPGTVAYCMSKASVRALCDALRAEVAADGVSVTHFMPGFIESEIRKVDNAGEYHPEAKDRVPPWLIMPAPKAARLMLRALEKRRAEQIITRHGRILVGLARYAPWVMRMLFERSRAPKAP